MLDKLSSLQSIVQDAIDKGATSVEEVHKSIAAMPLDLLAKVSGMEEMANTGKAMQDQTIGTIYDTIRTVNQKAGEIAGQLLNKK